jgi:signal transduction histidine kinase
MAGNMSNRVPVRGTRGEFDMLAQTINEMLDRISTLMENVQQISNDIAHDLRTPLSRLRNRLELTLAEVQTGDDYRQAITRTISDCETILSTFGALLRIGQIEAATGTSPSSRVDLSALLNELVEIYQPAAEDGGYSLTGNICPGYSVHGDQVLLSQVFANLVENAMAHTPRGTTIVVKLAQDGEAVVATVADNGPGIPSEERARVLRRFYRCERSRSSPGSGLGLSLVAAIAKYHQAKLTIADNQPGVQVVLRFSIAAAVRTEDQPPNSAKYRDVDRSVDAGNSSVRAS